MSATTFLLKIHGIETEFDVVSFKGREALSRPFRFDVKLLAPQALDISGTLGRAARLDLWVGGKQRTIAGMIAAAVRGDVLADGQAQPSIRLVPQIVRLSTRRLSRIFQDQTTGRTHRWFYEASPAQKRKDLLFKCSTPTHMPAVIR